MPMCIYIYIYVYILCASYSIEIIEINSFKLQKKIFSLLPLVLIFSMEFSLLLSKQNNFKISNLTKSSFKIIEKEVERHSANSSFTSR